MPIRVAFYHRMAAFALSILVLLILSGCAFFPEEEAMLAPPLIESPKVEYVTAPVELKSIRDMLTNIAYFAPSIQSNVAFTYSGRLETVNIYEGTQVEAGDVLASFLTEDARTQIRDKRFEIEKLALSLESALEREQSDTTVYAEADGVITQLRAVAGDKAEDIARRYGALAYIVGPESRLSITVSEVPIKLALGVSVYVDVDGVRMGGVIEEVSGGNSVDLWKPPLPSASPQPTMVWNGLITVRLDEGEAMPIGSEAKVSLVAPSYAEFYLGTGKIEATGGAVTASGIIGDVLVTEGQRVERGDVLMTIKNDTYSSRNIEIDLNKASAELRDLELELERSQIVAPIAGKVTYVNDALVINDRVDANTTLCRIADRTTMVLEYRGEKATQYPLGLEVLVRYKGDEYTGEVVGNPDSFPRGSSGETQKIVRFLVDDFDMLSSEIADGDSATIEAIFQQKDEVVVVPKQYIQSYLGRRFVNILVDGVKEERDVELGIETSTEAEIVKGLQVGDEIIIR